MEKTTDIISEPVFDHFGEQYGSVEEMCAHYGIPVHIFRRRRRDGMPLADALIFPVVEHTQEPFRDHLGNSYPSLKDMCEHYRIQYQTYYKRVLSSWSVERALTTPEHRDPVKDHLGNVYRSKKDMCQEYGISDSTLNKRLRKGMSLKEALTGEP